MKVVKTDYTGEKSETLEQYYDVISRSGGRFDFLSPAKWPEWLDTTTDWMCTAGVIAEVGCGYGEVVEHYLIKSGGRLRAYYLIDISQGMLDQCRQRIARLKGSEKVSYLKRNIIYDSISEITQGSLEKVVIINVLQDVDPRITLRNLHGLLQPGGQLRATFIKRETQDLFWQGDEDYDSTRGCLYNFSVLHENAGIAPLGYVQLGTSQKPFYRVQTYFTEDDVRAVLAETGYHIVSTSVITLPIELVMKRWSSEFHRITLNERQKRLLEQWNGFPDSWDVIAERR